MKSTEKNRDNKIELGNKETRPLSYEDVSIMPTFLICVVLLILYVITHSNIGITKKALDIQRKDYIKR